MILLHNQSMRIASQNELPIFLIGFDSGNGGGGLFLFLDSATTWFEIFKMRSEIYSNCITLLLLLRVEFGSVDSYYFNNSLNSGFSTSP